jgi:hypothetical protein
MACALLGNQASPLGLGYVVWHYQKTARYGTLLQFASTPALQAALPAVSLNRRMWIPLGRCRADRDSGRDIGQRAFIRKMRSFEEPHAFASHEDVVKLARYGTLLQSVSTATLPAVFLAGWKKRNSYALCQAIKINVFMTRQKGIY